MLDIKYKIRHKNNRLINFLSTGIVEKWKTNFYLLIKIFQEFIHIFNKLSTAIIYSTLTNCG